MNKKWLITIPFVVLLMITAGCSKADFPIGSIIADQNNNMKFTFNEDGTYRYEVPWAIIADGEYSIEGNKLTWGYDTFCGEENAGAVYEWKVDGNEITFQSVSEDGCSERKETMIGIWLIEQ